jgi:hypothetical protein
MAATVASVGRLSILRVGGKDVFSMLRLLLESILMDRPSPPVALPRR